MNKTLIKAREFGVTIIHAPSGTMDFYKDTPQRNAAIETPNHKAPEGFPINDWCYLDKNKEAALPIDDSDGGCDKPCTDGDPCEEMTAWSRQIASIRIEDNDFITDQGQEVFNIMVENNIDHIVVMGVHLNMCVLGRPFAIRQMANLNKNVVLMRDMTDTMYNPEMAPYVSHFEGTRLVIDHVEKYWAPTMVSSDFTSTPAFAFNEE
jgi:nicotinamidase-related amidase